jgi:GNAT superfamily N-acetyltransferase
LQNALPRSIETKKALDVTVRRATRADSSEIVELIVGLAKFEHLEAPNSSAKIRLVRDIFEKKLAEVFVASKGNTLVGYVLYFYTYSSFLARPTLYLEDIFIRNDSRRTGIGRALFMRCVREAKRLGCGRMEWSVLTWNRKAINFYEGIGARKIHDQRLFRLDNPQLLRLSKYSSI